MEKPGPAQAQRRARLAGLLYLALILASIPGIGQLAGLVVVGDGRATAANLLARRDVVQLAFAGYLISTAGYVAVMGLFYTLFRPVNREAALIALLFSVVGCAVGAVSVLFVAAALLVLEGPYPPGLGVAAGETLSLLFVQLFLTAYGIGLVFFGLQCVITGALAFLSRLLPRLLGASLAIGGIGYLSYLSPQLASSLFPFNVIPGYLTEAVLTIWLLVRGIDERQWARLGQKRD